MKKTKKDRDKGKKQLVVSKEKVRDLRPLPDDKLVNVATGCGVITYQPPP